MGRPIFSRETPEKRPGLYFTDASTRRVLKRRLPKSVPRGLKSSKEQLLEPHSKTLWLKGIRNPKCERPNVNKLFVPPRKQRRPQKQPQRRPPQPAALRPPSPRQPQRHRRPT